MSGGKLSIEIIEEHKMAGSNEGENEYDLDYMQRIPKTLIAMLRKEN